MGATSCCQVSEARTSGLVGENVDTVGSGSIAAAPTPALTASGQETRERERERERESELATSVLPTFKVYLGHWTVGLGRDSTQP